MSELCSLTVDWLLVVLVVAALSCVVAADPGRAHHTVRVPSGNWYNSYLEIDWANTILCIDYSKLKNMIVTCCSSTVSPSVWGAELVGNTWRLAHWVLCQCLVFLYLQEKLEKVDKDNNFQIKSADCLLVWHLFEDWSELFSIDIFLWGILIPWSCETIRDRSGSPSTPGDRVVTVRFHAGIVGVRSIRHPHHHPGRIIYCFHPVGQWHLCLNTSHTTGRQASAAETRSNWLRMF